MHIWVSELLAFWILGSGFLIVFNGSYGNFIIAFGYTILSVSEWCYSCLLLAWSNERYDLTGREE